MSVISDRAGAASARPHCGPIKFQIPKSSYNLITHNTPSTSTTRPFLRYFLSLKHPHHIFIMFRQSLSASSRALRSAAPKVSAPQPLLRPQFRTVAPAYSLRAAQPVSARWYSDAKEAPAEEKKEEGKDGEAANDPLAELNKKLEAKDAEAREWKVCSPSSGPEPNTY